jgi:hexosaminidase
MEKFLVLPLLTACGLALSCAGLVPNHEKPDFAASVVPLPVFMESSGSGFTLDSGTVIVAETPALASIGELMAATLTAQRRLKLAIASSDRPAMKSSIVLSLDPSIAENEGYELTVGGDRIRIAGKFPAGVLYGVETLLQLIPTRLGDPGGTDGNPGYRIPGVHVKDNPRFPWRGMHLDVCRHFFTKEFIKKYLDLMAMHKMNVFHWHLTEDQGWRIEIKKYPKLTEIGAWRVDREDKPWDQRAVAGPGEKATYGGFYTQDDVREIVEYAARRFITVIPEIEMPAHAIAALAAYPELSCTGGPFTVMPGGIWPIRDIYCAGNETTFAFLEDVLTEVMDLFPSRYIHIGGDEAAKDNWKACPKCQARIRAEGLKDEEELQSYFIRRIEKFLISKNRKLIGWDEILQGGLAPEATVMSWRGMAGGVAAAQQGHEVVMTPTEYCYFDYYQAQEGEPPGIGGFLPLEKVYAFEPVPGVLTADQQKLILGGQGNVWTEYIPTPEHAEYMALPRMAAMAEVLWSPRELRNLDGFLKRMTVHYNRLDLAGAHYRQPGLGGFDEFNPFIGKVRVRVSKPRPETVIRYTVDGSEPGVNSQILDGPLTIRENLTLTAQAFAGSVKVGLPRRGRFEKQVPVPPVKPGALMPGLAYRTFEGEFSSVTDFERSTPVKEGLIDGFSVPKGMPEFNFGILYSGFLKVPATGVYSFSVASDDGSRFFLGDRLVADNDGQHGSIRKTAILALEAGFHPVKALYFQQAGGSEFEIRWSGPSFQSRPIPAAALWNGSGVLK